MTELQKKCYDALRAACWQQGNLRIFFHTPKDGGPGVTVPVEGKPVVLVNPKYVKDRNETMLILMHEGFHIYLNAPKNSVEEEADGHTIQLQMYKFLKQQNKDYSNQGYEDLIKGLKGNKAQLEELLKRQRPTLPRDPNYNPPVPRPQLPK